MSHAIYQNYYSVTMLMSDLSVRAGVASSIYSNLCRDSHKLRQLILPITKPNQSYNNNNKTHDTPKKPAQILWSILFFGRRTTFFFSCTVHDGSTFFFFHRRFGRCSLTHPFSGSQEPNFPYEFTQICATETMCFLAGVLNSQQ